MNTKRPGQTGFTHIKDLIDQILGDCRISPNRELLEIQRLWMRDFAKEITDNAYPAALNNGILIIHVKSSTLTYQLRFMTHDIIRTINQAFGDKRVSELKFKIKHFEHSNGI